MMELHIDDLRIEHPRIDDDLPGNCHDTAGLGATWEGRRRTKGGSVSVCSIASSAPIGAVQTSTSPPNTYRTPKWGIPDSPLQMAWPAQYAARQSHAPRQRRARTALMSPSLVLSSLGTSSGHESDMGGCCRFLLPIGMALTLSGSEGARPRSTLRPIPPALQGDPVPSVKRPPAPRSLLAYSQDAYRVSLPDDIATKRRLRRPSSALQGPTWESRRT